MFNFEDIVLERGNKRVVWEWIGEGNSGDYNEDDPEDTPLLRFSCYHLTKSPIDPRVGEQEWEEMSDASYCTRMPVTTNMKILARGASEIMEAIQDVNYKKRLEELSWLCPEDFENIA